jgi:hypothetical protein
MTPVEIIEQATVDGVNLVLTTTGTIKVTGEQLAVDRWLPTLRQNKADILAELQREVMRRKIISMLGAEPEALRAVYLDADSDPNNVILSIAIRQVATCEMLIPKDKYDPWRLLELIEKQEVRHVH